MVNYQLGKIYKIIDNTTNKIYIGSTCEPTLARRLAKHLNNFRHFSNGGTSTYITSFEIFKNDNYDIVLLESYPCNSKDELHSRERFYIENNICVNKTIPGRTKKEGDKIRYENNKEAIKTYVREYARNNSELIKERKRLYREKNKEQLKLKKGEKIICDICNHQYTKSHESRHRKSKFHLNCIEHDED
jgi:hypothetical protein